MNARKRPGHVLVALFLLLPVSSASAGHLSAVISGKSYHLGASEDWNENNVGLGIEYCFEDQSRWKKILMANGIRDSNEAMSYMAGAGLHRNLFTTTRLDGFYVDVGINAFLMMRRDVNDNRPFPGALPSLTIGNRHVGMNVTYLPEKAVEQFTDTRMTDGSVSGILFLQVKVSIGSLFR